MNKLVTAALAPLLGALSMSPTTGLAQEAGSLGERFQMADLNRCLAKAGDNPRSCIGTLSNECQITPDGSTTPGIVACEQRETELWDQLLNERYKAAMAATKERESDIQSFGGKPNAIASLREAQRKWVAFRDAECQRVFEYYAVGTIRGPAFAGCQLRRTAERAIDFAPENSR